MTDYEFGFSPCPNDTFAFHAFAHGLVGDGSVTVTPVMLDIEELNQRARRAELPVTKLSFGALAELGDTYEPLASGAALGHGVGPLVVSRDGAELDLAAAAAGRIAVPGLDTTAFLLLRLAAGPGGLGEVVVLRYDEILDAVASGAVDAGLIIHESRFTYADHGLVRVADLGEWWAAHTDGLPVPLATICVRRDVPAEDRAALESAIRDSVRHAFAHPEASAAWVGEHAQELSAEVCRQHIELYVNEHTIELDDRAREAVRELLGAAASAGRGVPG